MPSRRRPQAKEEQYAAERWKGGRASAAVFVFIIIIQMSTRSGYIECVRIGKEFNIKVINSFNRFATVAYHSRGFP